VLLRAGYRVSWPDSVIRRAYGCRAAIGLVHRNHMGWRPTRRELQRASVRRLAVMRHDVGHAVNHVAYMTLDPLRGRVHGLAHDLVAVHVSLEFKFEAIGERSVVDAVHRLVLWQSVDV
jgi:hypothetical protein